MDNSMGESSKKTALEDLSRDELVKKCKGLLVIAQKAKQAKDALQEENNVLANKLKAQTLSTPDDATSLLLENLTQQKLAHVTLIDNLKSQYNDLNNKYQLCTEELGICQVKNNELDNENVSYKRRVHRLTEENEQLITHLDSLEKQIEEFKRIGIQQQEELLALENNNKSLTKSNEECQKETEDKISELQSMLSVSLEGLKKLKLDNSDLNEKVDSLKINLGEKDKNILIISEELTIKSKEVDSLKFELTNLQSKNDLASSSPDLNELSKIQACTISKLEQSLIDRENEIIELKHSLQDVNELKDTIDKFKERVRFYHSKVVKLAGSVKTLKENKNEMITIFKLHATHVEDWKTQLSTATEKLINLLNSFELKNAELLKENVILSESNARMIEQLEAHKTDDEKSKEMNQIENMKVENKKLEDDINALLEQVQTLTIENETLKNQLTISVEKGSAGQNKIEESERICIEYRKAISKLEETVEFSVRELEECKRKNLILEEELEHLKANERQFAEKTSEEILKLVKENAELSEHNKKLTHARTSTIESECQTEKCTDDNVEETVTTLRRENAEVLAEMNEMNQALKERGETISKLQAHCEEVMKKLQIYETQANKNVDNISQKEELIKNLQQELDNYRNKVDTNLNSVDLVAEKDAEIASLRSEMDNLKERLHSHLDSSYADSECMSTSTISRTEEVNRLKDLEGSWEERYGKLRNLALKLKGKIRDLTTDLTKEQTEKSDLQQKYANSIKTITTLQIQCDKLEDDLEASKNQIKNNLSNLDVAAADISKDKLKLVENEETIATLRREIDDLNKEKANTDAWKKQISGKVQAFRKELEANKVLKKEYEANIAKLTAELEAKEQALKAESDCHKQTRSSLEQSNNERKKNSVLSLEMQDYERSVKELSQKLEKRQEEIDKLKAQNDSQKTTINALREQNKLLEERVRKAEDDLESTKLEVASYKKQISDSDETILQKDDKIQNVTKLLETARCENEELSTELSKVIAEHQKVNASLKNEKEMLRTQILWLQQSLRETQDVLKLKTDELGAIQSEYDQYKVRAQSVLRQNQSRDVGVEEKLSEEISSLRAQCEGLNRELCDCRATVESLKNERDRLSTEKDEAVSKYQEISSDIDDLKNLYDQLSSRHQQTIMEQGETVRSLKVHAETLAQCYRQQLSDQEVRHNREILELQNKIEKAPSPTEMTLPPLPTMPREEGEGSESVESGSKASLQPVPLERLLNFSDTDQEVTYARKLLQEEESKVMHLTALLADTEQDLAKHVQMNKLLKEEIRRQQRSVEREKHAENLEYLKNVVFKFVTLHSGDERSRLVPVLNTILKLSPEETQKLNMVAKGDPGLRGWTNYLPIWPSSSKS